MENQEETTAANLPETIPPRGKSHAPIYIAACLTAVVAILLAATCPDKNRHVDALTQQIIELATTDDTIDGITISLFNTPFAHKFIGTMVEAALQVNSYGVCSIGYFSVEGKREIGSIGILGHVFTPGIDNAMSELMEYDDIEDEDTDGGDNTDQSGSKPDKSDDEPDWPDEEPDLTSDGVPL